MHLQPECTVSGSLSFVLRLSRVFGTAPLSFESVRDGWRVHVSKIYSFYGRVLATFLVAFSLVTITADLAEDEENSFRTNTNAKQIVWIADIIIVGMVNLTAAYTGINRMRYMVHCVAQSKQMNQKMNHFHQPSDRNNRAIVIFTLMVACVTLIPEYHIFMNEVLTANGDVIRSSFYIFYIMCCVNLILYVMQFNQSVLWVLPSLQLLNSRLRDLLQTLHIDTSDITTTPSSNPMLIKKDRRTHAFNRLTLRSHSRVLNSVAGSLPADKKLTAATIHELGLVYCSLCEITRVLNESNGFILVVLLMSILLHLIITPYHLIIGLFQSSQFDYLNTFIQVSWGVFHFNKLLMIVEPCHRTRAEMDLVKDQINQIRRYTAWDDFATIAELKLFYRHIMLNYISYSPLQLFTINRTLIAAILGSITTYLVIVIQL